MAAKSLAVSLLVVLAIISGVQGRVLLQGPSSTSTVVVNWIVPSNGVIDAVRVPLNGNVTFSWTGLHDVWEIPTAQCPRTFANSTTNTTRQIARQSTGGTVSVPFRNATVRYFACSVSNHCQQGQLIAVRVGGVTAPAPGPRRSDGVAGYGGNASPGYAGGQSSNYGSGTNATGYSGSNVPGYAGGASANYGSGAGANGAGYGEDGVNNTPGYGGGSNPANYGSG